MKHARVLIVEDEVDLNSAYKLILESAGHKAASVYNGLEALDYTKKEGDPDVILLDLRMPVMDGIEFLKHYNAPEHPNVSIVLFSNYDAQKEVDEAYELGAERYVLKARASPKELLRIVDSTLSDKATK